MYERMLDKQSTPTMDELVAWCGESSELLLKLIAHITVNDGVTTEIRFPYGKTYGWCVTIRKKKKLICDIFAEVNAINVMLRLTNKAFDEAYPSLSKYTQEYVDAKYPCNDGGWIHYRITTDEHLSDIEKLLALKLK